jgi:hypothetical protein
MIGICEDDMAVQTGFICIRSTLSIYPVNSYTEQLLLGRAIFIFLVWAGI